ncbi:unnamed protein product [Nippostrongylus brasiliensis]|uniref:Uncharacterized protein n=1 Tax=Nippostrongylus brasiliensis TaxID=27835 RepID=A0A0N4XF11_NIPBR|nr:unnamed protein product [Nippostrongylus brasiliensis]
MAKLSASGGDDGDGELAEFTVTNVAINYYHILHINPSPGRFSTTRGAVGDGGEQDRDLPAKGAPSPGDLELDTLKHPAYQ